MIAFARAVHVLAVLWWVGGVAMVTATILPALARSGLSQPERLRMFTRIRARFVWQARTAVLLAGASGGYLLAHLGGAARLAYPQTWWISLMLATWGVFALLLFVIEPLRGEHKDGMRRPRAFILLHAALLGLALATVAAGVVGAHGGFY
ncbi:MAG TPA: hypothetical protein VFV10_03025 [Gammaproteobacteria bacterium]|nr:hypothetical protein [Gammaproteobacteria bacterium]